MLLFALYVAAILIGILIVPALLPSRYRIEKHVVIHRPVEQVMEKIGDLSNYAQWNPWQQMDPAASREITGTPFHPGHRYTWNGKKVGMGSLTINNVNSREIHFDLEFLKPWKSHAHDNWAFEPAADGGTSVTWENTGNLPWPIARLMGPIINKNLNHQFEKGINNLKQLVERAPA